MLSVDAFLVSQGSYCAACQSPRDAVADLGASLADAPFFIINSSACWFMTYGLAGLRYEWWAIFQSTSIMCLHALVANQGLTMCIWLCTGQVSGGDRPAGDTQLMARSSLHSRCIQHPGLTSGITVHRGQQQSAVGEMRSKGTQRAKICKQSKAVLHGQRCIQGAWFRA